MNSSTPFTSRSVPQRVISAQATQIALQGAVAHAASLGIVVNVAVTDASGVLAGFLRMPGAFLHSVEIAIDKAYTAASFGFPTSAWPGIFAQEEALRMGLGVRPRLVSIGGGLPIVEDGVRIGGIGVSGGSAEQDEACARAGLAAAGLA
jgi:uncharacterized protein GlcG (DUF336 family)